MIICFEGELKMWVGEGKVCDKSLLTIAISAKSVT